MPTDHNRPSWPSQRHYLTEALKHLSAFTDNLQTFLELADEAEHAAVEAQVLTLDFGTTSDTLHTVMDSLRDDANENPTLGKRPKRQKPSREVHPNQRKPWTFDEEQAIRSALLLGFDRAWIAHHLGRNERAVQDRMELMRKAGEL
jgi:hypothetical protein